MDTASLVLAFALQVGLLYILFMLKGVAAAAIPVPAVLMLSLKELATQFLDIYMYSLIIIAIASWVAPGSHNPGLMLLHQITEPMSSRIRKVIPPLGGLDFSLMVMVLIIITLKNFIAAL